RSSYEPDAPARGVPQRPRWRVGLVCARMRNFLAGVISPHRSPSGLGNNPKQFAPANWLGQVLIDADFPGAPPVFLAGIARDDDDPRSGERFVFSHSPSDLVAVQPGQPEIEEDHIGSESRRLGEGPKPIVADVDLVPG